MPATTFEQVQKGVPALVEQFKTAHTEAQGVSTAFGSLLHTLAPLTEVAGVLRSVFGHVGQSILAANAGLTNTVHQLDVARSYARIELNEMRQKEVLTQALYNEAVEHWNKQARVYEAQRRLAGEVELIGGSQLALAKGLLLVLGSIALRTRELNQNLINANSAFMLRNKLMYDTLVTQVQIGSSFGQTTEAARALVHYGLEQRDNFQQVVQTVVMLNQGIGM